MNEIQAEWEEALAKLNDKWIAIAEQIEEVRITPKKSDIVIPQLGLGWAPFWECRLAGGKTTLVPAYRRNG